MTTQTIRRPPGRPKVAEHGTSVSTWLRPHEHDQLIRLAKQREISVSALVRSMVVFRLKP